MIGTENGLSIAHNSRLLGELDLVMSLKGDIADIGCWKGSLSFLIAKKLLHAGVNKKIFLFDTFCGHIVEQFETIDKSWSFSNKLDYFRTPSVEKIRETFDLIGFKNYEIVIGDVTETLRGQFCFASLDMNFYTPTKAALDYLQIYLSEGGVVIEDDYNNIRGINQAFEESSWLKVKNLYEPAGASFIRL